MFGFVYGLLCGMSLMKKEMDNTNYNSKSRNDAYNDCKKTYLDSNGNWRSVKTNNVVYKYKHISNGIYDVDSKTGDILYDYEENSKKNYNSVKDSCNIINKINKEDAISNNKFCYYEEEVIYEHNSLGYSKKYNLYRTKDDLQIIKKMSCGNYYYADYKYELLICRFDTLECDYDFIQSMNDRYILIKGIDVDDDFIDYIKANGIYTYNYNRKDDNND